MNKQQKFQDLAIKNLKNNEFLLLNKSAKSCKVFKFFKGTSFVVLVSSLVPHLSSMQIPVAIIGITGVLFFDNKIRNVNALLENREDIFIEGYKKQLNSMELADFRIKNLNDLKKDESLKKEYISLVDEELQLIFEIIKDECISDLKVNISTYKNDIEHINEMINIAVSGSFISKEDAKTIKKKWLINMQSLYNIYLKTDIEEDLKYLQVFMTKKEV